MKYVRPLCELVELVELVEEELEKGEPPAPGKAYTTKPKPSRNIIAKIAMLGFLALAGFIFLHPVHLCGTYNGWVPGSEFQ